MVHDKHLLNNLLLPFNSDEQGVKYFLVLLDVFLEVVRTVLSSLQNARDEGSALLDFFKKLICILLCNKSIVDNLYNRRFIYNFFNILWQVTMELHVQLVLNALWLGESAKLRKNFSQKLLLAFSNLSLIPILCHSEQKRFSLL